MKIHGDLIVKISLVSRPEFMDWPYWIDTLKKNYLAGPALVLVKKLEDMEEIWKKLIDSYGNA